MGWRKVSVICVTLLALPFALFAGSQRLMWNAKVDLNGDGKPEVARAIKLGR